MIHAASRVCVSKLHLGSKFGQCLQVYYHNTVTGESSWQKPEGFNGKVGVAGGTPVPISSEDIPMTGWAEVACIDGRKYFYHADRQVSTCSICEACPALSGACCMFAYLKLVLTMQTC